MTVASKRVDASAGKGKETKRKGIKASRAAPTREKAGAAPQPPEADPAPAQLSPEELAEEFADTLTMLMVSIDSPYTAHRALQAYNMGLNFFIQGTNPGYPYPEMRGILTALERAHGDIARHGQDGGARQAKGFLQAMVKLAWHYKKQRRPTHRELVLGALRSPGHALTQDGRTIQVPSYFFLAKAILHNRRSRADFDQQVSVLEARLAEYFGPDGIDPESDLEEVARQAFKVAGINPHNALDAPERMRAVRERRRRRV
ncbi:hypothetical protein ACSRUE_17025 [Sorangium sp. KYC3313]|uniref:hypothetical protein n=1 Tax=Sorangium sp. KYC3313 TaxID=3449740 RepID=UPI003F8C0219